MRSPCSQARDARDDPIPFCNGGNRGAGRDDFEATLVSGHSTRSGSREGVCEGLKGCVLPLDLVVIGRI